MGDSARVSRVLAAVGLVVGPLLLALGALLDTAWEDDAAAYLAEVDAAQGRYLAAGIVSTVGTLVFILGSLGIVRLMRRRGISLGQAAGALLTFGLIGLSPTMAFYAFDVLLADAADRGAAVAIYEGIEDSVVVNVYWMVFFFAGIVLGAVLLAVALLRRRIVPLWAPIVQILSLVVGFFADTAALSALAFALLAVGLAPVAMRILGLSDEEWTRWEPPVAEHRREGAGAVGAAVD